MYISTQANSLADLKSAILSALGGNGWTVSSDTATRNGIEARFDISDVKNSLSAQYSQMVLRLAVNDAHIGHCVGDAIQSYTGTPAPVPQQGMTAAVFPVTVHLFINTDPDEVYCFFGYSVDFYMWLAFGKSPVPGLPGTGVWSGGSMGCPSAGGYGAPYTRWPFVSIAPTSGGGGNSDAPSCALFWNTYESASSVKTATGVFHHGYDVSGVSSTNGWGKVTPAVRAAAPHIERQPNVWNSEAILIPIRPMLTVAENKTRIVGELQHARYLRIDNYAPEEVITLGTDEWKVFPWYRKNTAGRDGGGIVNDSGTFGVAIRNQ